MRLSFVPGFFLSFLGVAVAHEVTVFNYSGSNLVVVLSFPVGKSSIEWPYGDTNMVFTHNGFLYSFPVTNDFQLTVDQVNVSGSMSLVHRMVFHGLWPGQHHSHSFGGSDC